MEENWDHFVVYMFYIKHLINYLAKFMHDVVDQKENREFLHFGCTFFCIKYLNCNTLQSHTYMYISAAPFSSTQQRIHWMFT